MKPFHTNNLLLAIIFLFVTFGLTAQYVSIPDADFEQLLIDKNIDSDPVPDGQVLISDVSGVTSLGPLGLFDSYNIQSLEGIEAFTSLEKISLREQSIATVDLTALDNLHYIDFSNGGLISISMKIGSSIDTIDLSYNNLTSLDVSHLPDLTYLRLRDNDLSSLNINNGNNHNFTNFNTWNNPNLYCIRTDNPPPTSGNWNLDPQSYFSGHPCDSTYVPDDNFEQKLIDLGLDSGLDDYVLTSNISAITTLDVSSSGIFDLTGIEDFLALITLDCSNNNLTSIDVSANTELITLKCYNNSLSALDVSNNVKLVNLQCYFNQLTSIDVTMLPNLVTFYPASNNLTAIDVSQNPQLKNFNLQRNPISHLDVSNNPLLIRLRAHDLLIDSINLTNNPNLTGVFLNNGVNLRYINMVNGGNSNIIDFDTRNSPGLSCIAVDDANAAYLSTWLKDVHTSFNGDCMDYIFTYVPDDAFEQFLIDNGWDDTLDDYVWTANIDTIGYLELGGTSIMDLTGIEDFSSLDTLYIISTEIGTFNFSNDQISYLFCFECGTTNMDLSGFTNLKFFFVYESNLTSLNISSNLTLDSLDINADIPSLDLSLHTNLKKVNIRALLSAGTAILPVTNSLQSIITNNYHLSGFNATNYPNLTTLDLTNPNLNTIDLSSNLLLKDFRMRNTPITSLDLSHNSALTSVRISDTNLETINVQNGNNSQITYFNSNNNNLLYCIQVDDAAAPYLSSWFIGAGVTLSEDCLNEFYTYVPDNNFEQFLIDNGWDDVKDDYVWTASINQLTSLTIYDVEYGIQDFTGLEDFDSLKQFSLYYSSLDSLDFSFDNVITDLNLDEVSFLEDIDLAGCTKLETLSINQSLLTQIDLAAQPLLNTLSLTDGGITQLDLSNNPLLSTLIINNNPLISLDLTSLPLLTEVTLDGSNLTFLNIQNGTNASITQFISDNNPDLFCIQVDDSSAPYLSTWTKEAHTSFSEDCLGDFFTYVPDDGFEQFLIDNGWDDILNDYVFTSNIDTISTLIIDGLGYTIFNLVGIEDFTSIDSLRINLTNINTLSLLNHPDLTSLFLFNNQLSNLDLSGCPKLELVDITEDISSLDLTHSIGLKELRYEGIFSGTLDLSQNNALEYLELLSQNEFVTPVVLPSNAPLKTIGVFGFAIPGFSPDAYNGLQQLILGATGINSLDLSQNVMLEELWITQDTFPLLDLSQNVALTFINIFNTGIEHINLQNGNNSLITAFSSSDNGLLACIKVDDENAAYLSTWQKDVHTDFSEICDPFRTYIPDDNFEQILINMGLDNVLDDYVVTDSITSVEKLLLYESQIADLTGLEDFTSLRYLDVRNTFISEINLWTNTLLDTLLCSNNGLTQIDLENNIRLTYVNLSSNNLSSINLPDSTALKHLNLNNNNFSQIFVNDYPYLEELYLASNNIQSLDLSQNPNLFALGVANNNLTALDVTSLPLLKNLYVNNNMLSDLDVSSNLLLEKIYIHDNNLSSIDLSNHVSLAFIFAQNNDLLLFDVANGNNTLIQQFNSSGNPDLLCIQVDDENAGYLSAWNTDPPTVFSTDCLGDFYTHIPDDFFEQILINMGLDNVLDDYVVTDSIIGVDTLDMGETPLADLTGIQDFTGLKYLDVRGTSLGAIDVSNNILLEYLDVENLGLNNIDVSHNIHLIYLNIQGNNISSIDLSQNNGLKYLIAGDNLFTSIDISNLLLLEDINVRDNQITNLDISNKPQLRSLDISGNMFTSLDISYNPLLISLDVSDNILPVLDISNNPHIEYLSARNCGISMINVSHLGNLENLNLDNNLLTNIDLSQNPGLRFIFIDNNHLQYLNLVNNPLLNSVYVRFNDLMALDINNGNNQGIVFFRSNGNPDLSCIQVDDASAPYLSSWLKDDHSSFSNNCPDYCIDVSIFENGSWDVAPTINRRVVIRSDYDTAIFGAFDACGLTTENGATIMVRDGDDVKVMNGLIILSN